MGFCWALVTACRDARRNLRVLCLMVCTIVIGVAGVVALHGFERVLEQQMDSQSKILFGADLAVKLRGQFSKKHEEFLQRIPGERARELQFSSMAFFPQQGNSRFVLVSAVSQGYPLYGEIVSIPAAAARDFFGTKQALVDNSLATQFSLKVGDIISLGDSEFVIAGVVTQTPGAIDMQGAVAPKVFIPIDRVSSTGLLRRGSRVRSVEYFRTSAQLDLSDLTKKLRREADELYLGLETSDARRDQFKKIVSNVTTFSQLVALVAVILGAIGAASIAHVYIRRRKPDIGMLRCIGAPRSALILLFFIQVLGAGMLGSLLGVLLGVGFGQMLPIVLRDFLPISTDSMSFWSFVSIRSVLMGVSVGLGALFAFTFVPLLQVARIPPMHILRMDSESLSYTLKERLLFFFCSAATIFCLAILVIQDLNTAVIYTVMLLAAAAVLFALAEISVRVISHFRELPGSFAVRQGIANIGRPNNQTRVLLVVLGIGSFLVLSVSMFQEVTLQRIGLLDTRAQANTLLFDVQIDQQSGVLQQLSESNLEILDTFPLVSMRLAKVGSRPVSEILESIKGRARWPYTRMYRSTYRPTLESTEKLVEGRLVASVETSQSSPAAQPSAPIPVTLEQRIVKQLGVGIGDTLGFDVEGVMLEVVVVGVRQVDWQQLKPNFFVVFPNGALESAPQTLVITARAKRVEDSAAFQREMVKKYPNVSVLDIRLVQKTVEAITSRLGSAAQFLGFLCVAVAIVMLLGTVISTQEQRVHEFQVLKFHGATVKTVLLITLVEYGVLSSVAVLFGLLGSYLAAALFSLRLFDRVLIGLSTTTIGLALLIVFIGVFLSVTASGSTYRKSASALLR